MMQIFLIALFGVLGVLLRYGGNLLASRILPHPFPYGTFTINLIGSFLIGIVYVLSIENSSLSPPLRLGIMVGFLGGFTTFSSYSLEFFLLIEKLQIRLALLYGVLSPLLGLVFVAIGIWMARLIFKS